MPDREDEPSLDFLIGRRIGFRAGWLVGLLTGAFAFGLGVVLAMP
jgi:hypothetical protein